MAAEEFDDYGATRKTLKSFLDGYAELAALIKRLYAGKLIIIKEG